MVSPPHAMCGPVTVTLASVQAHAGTSNPAAQPLTLTVAAATSARTTSGADPFSHDTR